MKKKQDEWLLNQLRGCTFDDFLISPGWGKAKSRRDISLVSSFSERVTLNVPIVASNMDTVTGARTAITIAQEGGIGIIHRYLSIEDECKKIPQMVHLRGSYVTYFFLL